MAFQIARLEVMAAGFSASDYGVIKRMAKRSRNRPIEFKLRQNASLSNIDIVLLNVDEPAVVERWSKMIGKKSCPAVVYVGSNEFELDDFNLEMDLLSSSDQSISTTYTKPMRSKGLMNFVERLVSHKMVGAQDQSHFPNEYRTKFSTVRI